MLVFYLTVAVIWHSVCLASNQCVYACLMLLSAFCFCWWWWMTKILVDICPVFVASGFLHYLRDWECLDTVGWVICYVKTIPKRSYNVLSLMLSVYSLYSESSLCCCFLFERISVAVTGLSAWAVLSTKLLLGFCVGLLKILILCCTLLWKKRCICVVACIRKETSSIFTY